MVDMHSRFVLMLDLYGIRVMGIRRWQNTNRYVVTIEGEDPPYCLLAAPFLELGNEKVTINF